MRDNKPVVDSDRHVIEPDDLWVQRMPSKLKDRAPRPVAPNSRITVVDGVEVPPRKTYKGSSEFGGQYTQNRYSEASKAGFNAESQVQAMDEEGIDVAVMFPSRALLVFGVDGVDPVVTTAAAVAYNDWLAEFVSDGSQRMFGVGVLDLRDVEGARAEAKRCVDELGFVALFVRPNPVNGRQLHDEAYEPLWAEIAALDVPICFHEGSAVLLPQVATDRFEEHGFWHACTHPMEQQIAMLAMVLGGVLDRHPTLRCGFMEAGAGWLPYWSWRLTEAHEADASNLPPISMEPADYIKRQCFVSADSDEDTAPFALEHLGGTNVIWGSDYPHADGKYPNAVKSLSGLEWKD
ncbi:MAG: amidohydrolase family protein, partial [Acidimicrobiales bacterium]